MTSELPVRFDPVLAIARMAHQMNCSLVYVASPFVPRETEPSDWDTAPAWQRETVIEGVQAILDGRVTGAGDSHRAWSEKKVSDGWIHGPVKDPEAKTHPCLVPFEDLPPYQQLKDHIFFQTVKHMIQELGARPT
jgi:hypothetical protein